jgi:hypothetical protein
MVLLGAAFTRAEVTTYFTSADIGGGIYGSAVATVSTGAGYVDVTIQNTSPLGQIGDDWANPFITELEFTFPDGLVVDTFDSQVTSVAGSSFGQGAGSNVLSSAGAQILNYTLVDRDDPMGLMKKCLMSRGDAVNNQNDNTIASANVLNGLVPQEDRAVGFLNPDPGLYSGAVFDAVTFHIEFTDELYHVEESFYAAPDSLVVKYQGGGDYSYHAYNVPEPSTIFLLGATTVGMVGIRRFFSMG